MRCLRFLPVLLLVLVAASSAHATRIIISDPNNFPLTPITSSPFQVTFQGDCSTLLPGSSDAGCFGFLNRSGENWTGMELTVAAPLGTYAFDCGSSNGVFAQTSCSYNSALGEYVLDFSNGIIPTNTTQYYVISEDDLPPGSISFNATYAAATPEPPAVTLLLLGAMGGSLLVWSRRRKLA